MYFQSLRFRHHLQKPGTGKKQSGEPITTGAEARVPGVFGGDGAQDLDHLQGSLRGSGARYGGLPQDCVWIDEDKT